MSPLSPEQSARDEDPEASPQPRFSLGQIVATPGALEVLQQAGRVLSSVSVERNDRFSPFFGCFFRRVHGKIQHNCGKNPPFQHKFGKSKNTLLLKNKVRILPKPVICIVTARLRSDQIAQMTLFLRLHRNFPQLHWKIPDLNLDLFRRYRGETIFSTVMMERTGRDPAEFLARHVVGDWGDLDDEDKQENELSVEQGYRIFSAYKLDEDTKIWIITEHDRSATTILLPQDY